MRYLWLACFCSMMSNQKTYLKYTKTRCCQFFLFFFNALGLLDCNFYRVGLLQTGGVPKPTQASKRPTKVDPQNLESRFAGREALGSSLGA